MIEFSQIPDKLNYPRDKKSLRAFHSRVVSYFIDRNVILYRSDKQHVVDILNKLTHAVLSQDFIPKFDTDDSVIEFAGNYITDPDSESRNAHNHPELILTVSDIDWSYFDNLNTVSGVKADVVESRESTSDSPLEEHQSVETSSESTKNAFYETAPSIDAMSTLPAPSISIREKDSAKEDLFIQGPKVPRFDVNAPFLYQADGNDILAIYTTLPLVPNKQCEISCTTDINLYSDSDLLKLYPNRFIPTRSEVMYDKEIASKYSLEYDDTLGILIPIEGYTMKDVRDNMIEYPHIFQLRKRIDDDLVNFYSTVEIDGKLHKITEMWDVLKDTKRLPKSRDFMKEYVVRRYLLERDKRNIIHKYPMLGSLNPFLTLFMTPEDYLKYGYYDSVGMARSCVNSRVEYHRSRNPILRRLGYYA